MSNQILVPSLGESVTEATVSKWLKKVGEEVDSDEPLVELETDKVNVEVPSPLSGTLSSIKVNEGDTVGVGTLLGLVKQGKISQDKLKPKKEVITDIKDYTPPTKSKKKKTVKKDRSAEEEILTLDAKDLEKSTNDTLVLETLAEDPVNENVEKKYIPPKTKKVLAPSVRKIVKEQDIDISEIEGTGKDGIAASCSR